MNDPFQTLGVARNCTQEELRGAYRELARRWHPDRFMAGPEREWANARMTEINAAYRACADELRSTCADGVNLDAVHALIQDNRFSEARHALLRSNQRGARWNYLFGTVLQKQGEVAKALTYFNFAVRQAPDNGQYRRARDAVQRLLSRERVLGALRTLRPARSR
ncbi:MAG: J domain-containing protein [Clostridia bacterium]|nr:J domain-containing protein [Clostridia bacterium]